MIIKYFTANFLNALVNLALQIVLVPLYINYWGIQKYSDWLLILSGAALFTYLDFGITNYVSNKICILYSENKKSEIYALFSSSIIFIITSFLFFFSLVFIVVKCFPFEIPNFQLNDDTLLIILACFTINVMLTLIHGLNNSIFRFKNIYHKSIKFELIFRLVELSTIIILVINNFSLISIAISISIIRIIDLINRIRFSNQVFKLRFSFKKFDINLLSLVLKKSISFTLVPLSHAIQLQVIPIIIKLFMGSTFQVFYTTLRVFVNQIKTIYNLQYNSFLPIVTNEFGKNNFAKLFKIHSFTFNVSIYLSFLVLVIFFIIGYDIYVFWTGFEYLDPTIFYTNMLLVVSGAIYIPSTVFLIATNNYTKYSFSYFIYTILNAAFLIYMTNTNYTFLSVISFLVISEFLFSILVFKLVKDFLKFDINKFFVGFLNFPKSFKHDFNFIKNEI